MQLCSGCVYMRVALTGSGSMVPNGSAFCCFIVEHSRTSGAQSSCCRGPTCGCVRTPTDKCAGNLPSIYYSQPSCVAGEQVFHDSCSMRPSSLRNTADAEITLISSILMCEPEVPASARSALLPTPGVDSPLLRPPAHPQGAAPPTCLAASF